jgi:UPF0271 protein
LSLTQRLGKLGHFEIGSIDLNSDMGESLGPYVIGNDEEMMKIISSANVGCGFHGGDPLVMHKTLREL